METKNLDGETNLKIRKGMEELAHIKTPTDCLQINGFIDSEPPSSNLYSYSGTLNLIHSNTEDPKENRSFVPIGGNGILLRGCLVRNTTWVIGIVAFTGPDTKIMLNSGDTPSKRSRVDKQINPHILLNFAILGCLCLICGVVGALYNSSFRFQLSPDSGFAADQFNTDFLSGLITFFNCMIIFQNIIPIALYISLEATKSAQSFFIHLDVEMLDEETGNFVEPKSWNLCDDLGQIEYIFSDKTGTLTSNTMELRKVSINGKVYGHLFSDVEKLQEESKVMMEKLAGMFDTKYIQPKLSFIDPNIVVDLKANEKQSEKIREFFTLLALCHTVLLEKPSERQPDTLIYNSQSPDEAALVGSSRDIGFAFVGRDTNTCHLSVMGEDRDYEVMNVMEFNSDRKRMSVIIRRPEGQIILLCKGADSVIYDRLASSNEQDFKDLTLNHLSMFANDGIFLGFIF